MVLAVLLLGFVALGCVVAIGVGLVALVIGHLRPLGIRSRGGALLLVIVAVVGIAVAGDLTTHVTHPGGVPAAAPTASADHSGDVGYPYPQDALTRFVGGCERTGTQALCTCLAGSLQRHYSYRQFATLASTDNPSAPEYAVVAKDCVGK